MHSSESSPKNELIHLPLFVAIEHQAEQITNKATLFNKSMGQQLLAHLAADLTTIQAVVRKTAITLSAAIYDQSQLLRPGLPLFRVLSELLEASYSGQQFQPRLLAFGAHEGKMPQLEMQPDTSLPLGPFQLIPLQLSGAAENIKPLAEQLEHHFLEQGQLSAHSAQWLQEELGQEIVHARFMTLNDVLAMLYLQLETLGLEKIWDWVEKMLRTPNFSQDLIIENGPELSYHNTQVEIKFQSFDQWARAQTQSSGQATKYLEWINRYRQASLLLQAHGLKVKLHNSPEHEATTSIFCEAGVEQSGKNIIVQHLHPQLGLIAISARSQGQQFNYYPLSQDGLDDLQALIQARYSTNYPVHKYNGLCLNPNGRHLSTDIHA